MLPRFSAGIDCFRCASVPDANRGTELLELDDALTALAAVDERRLRVIELRIFGGLSVEETAEDDGAVRAKCDARLEVR